MATNKHIDKICCWIVALSLIVTILFMSASKWQIQPVTAQIGYESRLFDTSKVHTIDIVMNDWDGFLETCENEEYTNCSVVIDSETYKNVGIRAKGNTSLSSVAAYGNDRYSFKIEFDCYEDGKTYHGLDKISLNNIIQDNTYMKDYLSYQMMEKFGVDAPLCSYVYITVNGEEWGLYLAVEAVEESFLTRNYGNDYGELYKPDSNSMGGGRGNGGGFKQEDMEEFLNQAQEEGNADELVPSTGGVEEPPGGFTSDQRNFENFGDGRDTRNNLDSEDNSKLENKPDFKDAPNFKDSPDIGDRSDIGDNSDFHGEPDNAEDGMLRGSDDICLIYSDDEYDSYKNIFDNAKTDITNKDKDRLINSLKKLGQQEDLENVVDKEEVLRYFVVHNFVCNFDSYTGSMIHNYYLYEKDGKMSMIPWDYNLAFGGFEHGMDGSATDMVNYPIDSPISGGTIESRPMLAWIFADSEDTEMYHQYFAQFIESYFESGYFEEMMNSVKEMIAPYVEKDPTKFCTYEEFEKGFDTLKEFCLLRAESIKGQLNGEIPSTSEGQKEDSSSLLDASGITISDMGSMGKGMGDGRQMNRLEKAENSKEGLNKPQYLS